MSVGSKSTITHRGTCFPVCIVVVTRHLIEDHAKSVTTMDAHATRRGLREAQQYLEALQYVLPHQCHMVQEHSSSRLVLAIGWPSKSPGQEILRNRSRTSLAKKLAMPYQMFPIGVNRLPTPLAESWHHLFANPMIDRSTQSCAHKHGAYMIPRLFVESAGQTT